MAGNGIDARAAVFVISVASQLAQLHPQTLRGYERAGLVSPTRTPGGGRRYSLWDIEKIREVNRLSSMGVSVEGIREILRLREDLAAALAQNARLREHQCSQTPAQSRLPAVIDSAGQAIVVWRRDVAKQR